MSMSTPFTMPEFSPELSEIIDTHKHLFGGWSMTASPPEAAGVTNPPAEATPPAGDAPAKPNDVDESAWAALADPGKKALVAERAKADAEKQRADALQKQIDDATKTDEEKRTEELRTATDRAAKAELKALQYDVAAAKGLDLKLATRLVGATQAELEADAEALKTLVGATPATTKTSTTPRPDPAQGGGGGGGDNPRDAGRAEAQRRYGKTETKKD